jgi:hypothetical protein
MKQLPHSPDLSHLKKQTKELLRAFQQSDPSAIERFGESLPSLRGLSPAQLAAQPPDPLLEDRTMSRASLIVLIAFCSPVPVNFVLGQRGGAISNRTANIARSADNRTGYHGPVALGPLSINNKTGGIDFHKLLSMLGRPAAPPGTHVCYRDAADRVYLVVERGADDRRLVRGLTLSRINVCPEERINQASGFSTWATEKGIRLGSSATALVSRYGEPSQVDELRTDPEFYLSPYPLEQRSSSLPKEGRILSYLPKEGAPDTRHALFGIRSGVVVWMTLSDNE